MFDIISTIFHIFGSYIFNYAIFKTTYTDQIKFLDILFCANYAQLKAPARKGS